MASFTPGDLGHRDVTGLAQGRADWGRAGHWPLSLRHKPAL